MTISLLGKLYTVPWRKDTRCYPKVPEIRMLHENRVVGLWTARYHELYHLWTTMARGVLLWGRVFLMHFCDVVLMLFYNRTNLLKWLMWRTNRFAYNSASNSARWQQNHTKCLKKHLVIMLWAKHKPTSRLRISRMDRCQSMMNSILDDIQPKTTT